LLSDSYKKEGWAINGYQDLFPDKAEWSRPAHQRVTPTGGQLSTIDIKDTIMDESKKQAFVLMPFQNPYNSYYQAIFKPALEAAGYIVTRADDLFTPLPIMLDIQRSILEAHLILCEMSGKNPNVFYELGLAHAVGRPVILVSRKEEDIPFDLRHVRIILYDSTEVGWEEKLRTAITAAAKSVEENNDVWPPPLMNQVKAPLFLKESRDLSHELEEWKELHNLLQHLDTVFTPFHHRAKGLGDLESSPTGRRRKKFSEDIKHQFSDDWRPCGDEMERLVKFAMGLQHIDDPYDPPKEKGPKWIFELSRSQNALQDALEDRDHRNLVDVSSQFFHCVNLYLVIADDSLRRVVKKITI
jgi:hypothetical protein